MLFIEIKKCVMTDDKHPFLLFLFCQREPSLPGLKGWRTNWRTGKSQTNTLHLHVHVMFRAFASAPTSFMTLDPYILLHILFLLLSRLNGDGYLQTKSMSCTTTLSCPYHHCLLNWMTWQSSEPPTSVPHCLSHVLLPDYQSINVNQIIYWYPSRIKTLRVIIKKSCRLKHPNKDKDKCRHPFDLLILIVINPIPLNRN